MLNEVDSIREQLKIDETRVEETLNRLDEHFKNTVEEILFRKLASGERVQMMLSTNWAIWIAPSKVSKLSSVSTTKYG